MKILSVQNKISNISQKWDKQYEHADASTSHGRKVIDIGNRLRELENPTAAQIKEIIGNDSWTYQYECGECGEKFDEVAEVGQEPDYESATAELCIGCLRAAVKMLEDSHE